MAAARIASAAIAITLALAGCGPASGSTGPSPSPTVSGTPVPLGTATISATACVLDAPSRLPVGPVRLKVVNNTQKTARFFLIKLYGGHSFQELDSLTNHGTSNRPDWVAEQGLVDVPRGETVIMEATITQGSYALHCGYPNDGGGVTGFLKGPLEAS
jgi:hypothetical protein